MEIGFFIFNLGFSAVLFGGIAVLIAIVLASIQKADRSKYVRNACYFGLALAVFYSSWAFARDIGLITDSTTTKSTASSDADVARFAEILQGVKNSEIYLTPAIHREFWGILDRRYKTDAEKQKISRLNDSLLKYNQLFYRDMLTAVQTGKFYKSSERLEHEKWMLSQGFTKQSLLDEYDAMTSKVVAGQPVPYKGNEYILDEDKIVLAISIADAQYQRIQILFTRPTD